MKRLVLALSIAALLAGCDGSGDERQNHLVVATDATYQPMEYYDENNELVGFDIDLFRAIAEKAGYSVEFMNQPWDGIIPGLETGEYDAIVSSLTITEERSKKVLFTDPYYDAGQVIAVREDDTGIKSLDDLSGKKIGTQRGTTGTEEAKKVSGAEVVEYDSIDLAFLDLRNRQVDAVINDDPVSRRLVAAKPGYKLIGLPLTQEKYGIAVRKDATELAGKLNKALAEVKADGTWERLRKKWFEGKRESERMETLRYLASGMAVTLKLMASALLVGMLLGLFVALARLSRFRALSWPARVYVEVIRGLPLLVLLLFLYYGLPQAFEGAFRMDKFTSAVAAFGICYAAYTAEIFRAGIQSVDPGQTEAARALGLSHFQTTRTVVLPQAVRNILPALVNEAVALLKDTSLAAVIALPEITQLAKNKIASTYETFRIWGTAAFLYLVLTLGLTFLARFLEKRQRHDRTDRLRPRLA